MIWIKANLFLEAAECLLQLEMAFNAQRAPSRVSCEWHLNAPWPTRARIKHETRLKSS